MRFAREPRIDCASRTRITGGAREHVRAKLRNTRTDARQSLGNSELSVRGCARTEGGRDHRLSILARWHFRDTRSFDRQMAETMETELSASYRTRIRLRNKNNHTHIHTPARYHARTARKNPCCGVDICAAHI